ncbi:MAG: UDP-N-acetylglucosamine 2-epimerase (hydrolyzing) [Desulfobacteraceae bacterium]|nr:MAG: UDP-N-acetylglucosamine 2-epimerase (hydrolyzing) [Desulfobacteraceae bacterium]
MMKRKVCVVITARPSYARIKTALRSIEFHPDLELQLIVAASALLNRYGDAFKSIEKDGFKIDRRVYMILEGENLVTSAKSTGLGIAELATVFDNLQPDIVVTIADRFETMATAIAASYMNIPLVHVQGGEVTGSIDEKVRHSITKLADLHFVSTKKAKERVIRMGEDPKKVFVTGCPSIDLASEIISNPEMNFDPLTKYNAVGPAIDISSGYIVVMQHPVTTEIDSARRHIEETLHAILNLGIPALWFWPNVDAGSDGTSKGIRNFREVYSARNIRYYKNMMPEDFLRLVYNSSCVVGNSSVAIRECSFLGVPAVNIGNRQKDRERGQNVIDVDCDRKAICNAINKHMENGKYPSDPLYGDGTAGKQIAGLLATEALSIEKRLMY